jgi:hypothetical protein
VTKKKVAPCELVVVGVQAAVAAAESGSSDVTGILDSVRPFCQLDIWSFCFFVKMAL